MFLLVIYNSHLSPPHPMQKNQSNMGSQCRLYCRHLHQLILAVLNKLCIIFLFNSVHTGQFHLISIGTPKSCSNKLFVLIMIYKELRLLGSHFETADACKLYLLRCLVFHSALLCKYYMMDQLIINYQGKFQTLISNHINFWYCIRSLYKISLIHTHAGIILMWPDLLALDIFSTHCTFFNDHKLLLAQESRHIGYLSRTMILWDKIYIAPRLLD